MSDDKELKKWVSYYLNKGYSPSHVRQSLSSSYKSSDIDRAIKEVSGGWRGRSSGKKPGVQMKALALIVAVVGIVVIVLFGLPFLGIDIMDFFSTGGELIRIAELDDDTFVFSQGESGSYALRLSGAGEASISVEGASQWISVADNVVLSPTVEEIPIAVQIPEDADSGNYRGNIVVSLDGRSVDIPFTILVNSLPTYTSLQISKETVGPGDTIEFASDATDKDGDELTFYVCKDDDCVQEWCSEEGVSCTATISQDENPGDHEYVVKVCDHLRCTVLESGYFSVVGLGCDEGAIRSCTDSDGCTGNQTCTNDEWGECVAGPCGCEEGDTKGCYDDDGCNGLRNCTDGIWGECVAEPCRCQEGDTEVCEGVYGCEGIKTCQNEMWGQCIVDSCVCADGYTKSCDAEGGCPGIRTCVNGLWGECVAEPCICEEGESGICDDENGCEGTRDCVDGDWTECVPVQNWCDEDCDGTEETCKNSACTICQSHIYIAYNRDCTPCKALAYNIIEDIIGTGAPYAESNVELQLWTDDDNTAFIDPYVAEYTSARPSQDWFHIKSEWMGRDVPFGSFPNPYGTWISDNSDILDATSSYVCVCSASYECYCDELAGRQPMNNGCVDGVGGCLNETIDCGDGTDCDEESELMVEEVLIYFGL